MKVKLTEQQFRRVILKEQRSYENKPIILIGAQGTGKSTTSEALSKALGIPLISTDMSMVNKKYEEECKNEPNVEVEIERNKMGGVNYSSNKEYEFCVMNKLFDEYSNKKIVLDVGGSHSHWDERFSDQIKELYTIPQTYSFLM